VNSILVVRRDNIGDLVCTTPLLTALRRRYPRAWIGALVNSYNAPVLARNPDLDAVIAYTKLKHAAPGDTVLGALAGRIAAFRDLRRKALDCAVLATPDFAPRSLRLARWLGPKQVVGFSDGTPAARALERSVPLSQVDGRHEVERVFALAAHFGIGDEIPPLRLAADPAEAAKALAAFGGHGGRKVAVHVSARRPLQRWPAERYAALMRHLNDEHGALVMALWSPGPPDHPRHPGDDDKIGRIRELVGADARVVWYRTQQLSELIGAFAASDAVVCPDGGAMHLAAALGKPVVALFGDSPVERWRPWGVAHRVVRPESRDLAGLPVEPVLEALAALG